MSFTRVWTESGAAFDCIEDQKTIDSVLWAFDNRNRSVGDEEKQRFIILTGVDMLGDVNDDDVIRIRPRSIVAMRTMEPSPMIPEVTGVQQFVGDAPDAVGPEGIVRPDGLTQEQFEALPADDAEAEERHMIGTSASQDPETGEITETPLAQGYRQADIAIVMSAEPEVLKSRNVSDERMEKLVQEARDRWVDEKGDEPSAEGEKDPNSPGWEDLDDAEDEEDEEVEGDDLFDPDEDSEI